MATTAHKPTTRREQKATSQLPSPITLRLRPVIDLTSDQLLELSSLNDDLRLELTAQGELIIMPPAGSRSSDRNAEITTQLRIWAKRDGTGVSYDSSGGFELPLGGVRAPDASWVRRSRLEAFSSEEIEKYLPLCPDFVIELRSPSDRLRTVQRKMREWIANGARLGWLLDPLSKRVEVYRPDAPVQRLDGPESISADPELPGFALDLREIW